MNEHKQSGYQAPAIVLEMDLETRAGSSLVPSFDEFFEEE